MTQGIKSRLEQIRAGKVPEGYYTSGGYVIPSDWKLVPLQNYFSRLTRKNEENNENVLTISAQQGLVNQMEYYNNSYASEDKRGYSLLYKGDYSYNKSYSSDYPYGAIKRLEKYDKGVVSPLYICFEPRATTNSDFYIQYFEAGIFNREIYKIAQEGARNHGLLNVAVDDFFVSSILYPPLPEQQKIAEILIQCDKVITLKKERIEEEKKRKKWLMGRLLCQNYDADSPIGKYQKWKRVRLQEICFMKSGESITAKSINEIGKYPCFGGNGKRGYTDTYTHNGSYILIGRQGALCGNVTRVSGFFYASEHAIVTQAKNIDQSYLYFLLCDMKLNRRSESSAQPGLSVEKVLRMYVNIPTAQNYQALVGRVLSCADNTIRILEVELAQWQQKKKALMQLLLTGIVRVTA